MAPRFLLRAVKKAATKAAKSKAAKASAAKLKKAASSSKASKLRITSQNATAKAKHALKEKANKKAREAALKANQEKYLKPKSKPSTPAQREKAYRENKNTPTSKDKKVTAAAENKVKARLAAARKAKKAPTTIKASVKTAGRIKPKSVKKVQGPKQSTSQTRIANRRSQRAAQKKYANRTRKEAYVKFEGGNDTVKERKIARSPGLKKKSDSRVKSKVTTKYKTAAQKRREKIVKLQDRGAKYVDKRTPRDGTGLPYNSTERRRLSTAAANEARKPLKSQKNYSSGSRKAIYGPKTPKPKATNASQVDKGRVERNARADGRKAVAKYNIDARIKKMREQTSPRNTPGMTGEERKALRNKKTKEINTKAQRVRELSERKSTRKQSANKNNVSPSAAKQNQLDLSNRDWRNRMTDSKTRKLSESATRASSPGTPKKASFRRKDDAKPKAPKQSSTLVSTHGPGPKHATKTPTASRGSTKTTMSKDKKGQTTVSRPTAARSNPEDGFGRRVPARRDYAPTKHTNTAARVPARRDIPLGAKTNVTKPGGGVGGGGKHKQGAKVFTSSKTSTTPSTKQSAGYKAQTDREAKANKALRERNRVGPLATPEEIKAIKKMKPPVSPRKDSTRIKKSLRDTRSMTYDQRVKAQRAQNQSVPKQPDNRSKAQRDAARSLAPKTYEDYGRGTTTWSN
ncbi:hypothetical protein N8654_03210 [Synechococcus sp. AH-601-B19]|nr:hypothetical protein [Synechococcus sp. AH-601-B19]